MVTKEQAVAAADALLAPGRDILDASRQQKETANRKTAVQRHVGKYGATGFVIGGTVAYVLAANVLVFCFIGLASGMVTGRIFFARTRN